MGCSRCRRSTTLTPTLTLAPNPNPNQNPNSNPNQVQTVYDVYESGRGAVLALVGKKEDADAPAPSEEGGGGAQNGDSHPYP